MSGGAGLWGVQCWWGIGLQDVSGWLQWAGWSWGRESGSRMQCTMLSAAGGAGTLCKYAAGLEQHMELAAFLSLLVCVQLQSEAGNVHDTSNVPQEHTGMLAIKEECWQFVVGWIQFGQKSLCWAPSLWRRHRAPSSRRGSRLSCGITLM